MLEVSFGSCWIYVSLGLLAGILSGTLGVGSGVLLVPALVLLCQLPQKAAQGTALAVMVPMAVVGAIRYKLNPELNMDYQVIAVLAIGAVVGSLIGTEIAFRLPAHIVRKVFAVFILAVAIKMLFTTAEPATVSPDPSPNVERIDNHDHR